MTDTTSSVVGGSARVSLFGSRLNDRRSGGDVDLLVESTPVIGFLKRGKHVPFQSTEFNLTDKPKGFRSALEELLNVRGLSDPSEAIALSGKDPFYKTPFKVGETVSAVLTTIGIAANDLWELRHGRRQGLSVDLEHAAAFLRTVDYTRKQKARRSVRTSTAFRLDGADANSDAALGN